MIVEWNTHIFHPDQDNFPLHPCAFYKPEIPSKPIDPLTDYIEKMRGLGIDRAVLVHPEPYGDDHRVVLDCLEREPDLFVATSLFYPRDLAAPDKLQDLVEQQPIARGIERYQIGKGATGVDAEPHARLPP